MHGQLKLRGLAAALIMCGGLAGGALAQDSGLAGSVELVDPNVLRVCADQNNLPFTNEKQEGFENRFAEFLAGKLGKTVSYTYFPMVTGFVRKTLGEYKCDVILSYPQGDELVQNTNAYYRTAYALVYKPGNGLDGLDTMGDPRLKGKRIGIVAGTPPASLMARNGLMAKAKPYPLMVDSRYGSSVKAMVDDLKSGKIEVAVLWGPIAGYYGKTSEVPLAVVPLLKERKGAHMAFRITMGVRATDQEWKRTLNKLIRENQQEINAILLDYGVPLLDEQDRLIAN
jgi:quinoprotein dehydrogenase-associated probable ABC transporter substrate-binding protein